VVARIQKKTLDMRYSRFVALLEYNGITGYVDTGEIARIRPSGSSRLFSRMRRTGHIKVCVVSRVDKKKGMIDLSKKRVELGAAMEKEKAFAKAKLIHNVMRQVARHHDVDVEDLCSKVTWPLYKSHGTAYDVLSQRLHVDDLLPGLNFRQPGKDLSELAHRLKADIGQSLRRRLASQRVRVWAKIEVTCAEHAGILAIQGALAKGIDAGGDDCPISIRLITHPQFMVSTTCHQRADGLQAIERAFEAISGEIRSHGGTFFVRSRPMLEGPTQEEEEDDDYRKRRRGGWQGGCERR